MSKPARKPDPLRAVVLDAESLRPEKLREALQTVQTALAVLNEFLEELVDAGEYLDVALAQWKLNGREFIDAGTLSPEQEKELKKMLKTSIRRRP